MKKVLIIAYHFAPDNIVASKRSESYAKYFKENGLFPTVATIQFEKKYKSNGMDWELSFQKKGSKPILQENDNFNTLSIPRIISIRQKIYKFLLKLPGIKHISILIFWLLGNFDFELSSAYQNFKVEISRHLKENKYDLIIAIYSPHFPLRLAYELNKKFKIPYVLDFRDLWNNMVVSHQYIPGFKDFIYNFLIKIYWKKWLENAIFFTITNDVWLNKINEFSLTKGYVISNGYEEEQLNVKCSDTSDSFNISFVGSLYKEQNIDIFIDGVNLFIHSEQPENMNINFIGLKEKYRIGVKEELCSKIEAKYLNIKDTVPKEDAYRYINCSQLLFYPGFDTVPGWCSVKVYEYLASGNNILVSPGDKGIVDTIIQTTKAGKIANTAEEVADFIHEIFIAWNTKESISHLGARNEIIKYSRHYQVGEMAKLINQNLAL